MRQLKELGFLSLLVIALALASSIGVCELYVRSNRLECDTSCKCKEGGTCRCFAEAFAVCPCSDCNCQESQKSCCKEKK